MKLIDGARCRTGCRGTAGRGCPIQKLDYSLKKKGMNKNEKGNMEINSADHRDCTHCTLHITRSYELHVVLESFTISS